jgi:prepilin-type N-terminal cleavage/methylation domain-containing protein/prepilin-type processing-associated H-X9-DG protein
MCDRKTTDSRLHHAFTLLELLLVIALAALLAGLIFPTMETLRRQAESAACASNLRQIGLAVLQKVQDNGNNFPLVEQGEPADPFYAPEKGVENLPDALKPYGITDKALRCPSDVKGKNYFGSKGSSYEWFSFIDGVNASNPQIDLEEFGLPALNLALWRFPIAYDYDESFIHFGKRNNVLYGDAHVESLAKLSVLEQVTRVLQGKSN